MPPFAPSQTRLLYALRRAHLAVEARKEEALRDLGLLPSHYAVLINVWAHPGVTGAELARHLGVTPQNVANLVVRLAERGMLVRSPHRRHRHVLELQLTELGRSLLEQADARVASLESQVTRALGAERAADAVQALDAMRETFNQPVDSTPSIDAS